MGRARRCARPVAPSAPCVSRASRGHCRGRRCRVLHALNEIDEDSDDQASGWNERLRIRSALRSPSGSIAARMHTAGPAVGEGHGDRTARARRAEDRSLRRRRRIHLRTSRLTRSSM